MLTISEGGWDDHGKVNDASPTGNVFERLREKLPVYDRSIYALITDIYQRARRAPRQQGVLSAERLRHALSFPRNRPRPVDGPASQRATAAPAR